MIVQITPPSIQNIGWRTYIIFALLNAFWVPIIYLFFPETKGLELEDVGSRETKLQTSSLTTKMLDQLQLRARARRDKAF